MNRPHLFPVEKAFGVRIGIGVVIEEVGQVAFVLVGHFGLNGSEIREVDAPRGYDSARQRLTKVRDESPSTPEQFAREAPVALAGHPLQPL